MKTGHLREGESGVVLATQRPDSAALSGQIRDNMVVRVVGRLKNISMSVALLGDGKASEIEAIRGRFILSYGNEYILFQAAIIF